MAIKCQCDFLKVLLMFTSYLHIDYVQASYLSGAALNQCLCWNSYYDYFLYYKKDG